MKQKTLKGSFSLCGKGLHTGLSLTVTFNPAGENTGYKIQRIDLDGMPVIDAIAENVVDTQRGTVLGKGDIRVSTVEHGLAALYALGIDNCLIQVNGPEFPILDGSAIQYVERIKEVGIEEQNAPKDWYIIRKKIEVRDETTGSCITILPDEEFSLTAMCSFNSKFINSQFASLDKAEHFTTEIAPARTFVFVRDIEPLLKANLIKGGDLDNAIVIYEKQISQEQLDKLADMIQAPHHDASELGYIQNKALVWENECTRHKLLDIVGALALIGNQQQVCKTNAQRDTQARRAGTYLRSQRSTYNGRQPHPRTPAPPLPHAAGRQSDSFGSDKHCRREEHHEQRAVLPRTFPAGTGNARRIADRGHGTVRRTARIEHSGGTRTMVYIFHEDRRCKIPAESGSRRHAHIQSRPARTGTPRHIVYARIRIRRRPRCIGGYIYSPNRKEQVIKKQ